jgi:hypothetical protein
MMTSQTRRMLFAEACLDWLALAYRGLLYVLVTTPVWGTVLAFAIIWDRMHL